MIDITHTECGGVAFRYKLDTPLTSGQTLRSADFEGPNGEEISPHATMSCFSCGETCGPSNLKMKEPALADGSD